MRVSVKASAETEETLRYTITVAAPEGTDGWVRVRSALVGCTYYKELNCVDSEGNPLTLQDVQAFENGDEVSVTFGRMQPGDVYEVSFLAKLSYEYEVLGEVRNSTDVKTSFNDETVHFTAELAHDPLAAAEEPAEEEPADEAEPAAVCDLRVELFFRLQIGGAVLYAGERVQIRAGARNEQIVRKCHVAPDAGVDVVDADDELRAVLLLYHRGAEDHVFGFTLDDQAVLQLKHTAVADLFQNVLLGERAHEQIQILAVNRVGTVSARSPEEVLAGFFELQILVVG